MVHEVCDTCEVRIQLALDTYAAGVDVTGGSSTVELQRHIPTADAIGPTRPGEESIHDGFFILVTTVHRTESTLLVAGEEQTYPAASYTLEASLWHDGNRWFVLGLTESL
jgi:hypothetical protein